MNFAVEALNDAITFVRGIKSEVSEVGACRSLITVENILKRRIRCEEPVEGRSRCDKVHQNTNWKQVKNYLL